MELLIDIDIILIIGKGIKGGMIQVSKRYSKVNNKYTGESYNPSVSDHVLRRK